MQKKMQKVQTLLEALPFIQEFSNQIVVIKYGGSAQVKEELKAKFAQDILLLNLVGLKPVIVHGGGKSITTLLDALCVKSEFKNGLRVTNRESMRVAEMVLSGEINSQIVQLLNFYGAKAIGMSGKDAGSIKAKAINMEELGYTGQITSIDSQVLHNIINDGFIPVIAPIACGNEAGHPGFNINADFMASKVAVALGAKKVVFLTDTPGVLNSEKELLDTLSEPEIRALKEDGTIAGGMIPKVDSCLEAVHGGVNKAHIIDGRIEHSILLELFTDEGIGTQISANA